MDPALRIALFTALIIYFVILIYLFRRKMLNLKYSLLWIFCGLAMFLVAAFPGILMKSMSLIGVYNPFNGLFALISFFILIILMSVTSIVSKQNERSRRLAQTVALLEKRVRELEGRKEEV